MAYNLYFDTTGNGYQKVPAPVVYASLPDAKAEAKRLFLEVGLPVVIFDADTMEWVDAIDSESWEKCQDFMLACSKAEALEVEPDPNVYYGPEPADDEYVLQVTTDGYAVVNTTTDPYDDPVGKDIPPGDFMFRRSEATPFDVASSNERWVNGAVPGDVVEAQDKEAETPTLATIVPIDAYAYPPAFVKALTRVPAIGPGHTAATIEEWRANAKALVLGGGNIADAYPYTFAKTENNSVVNVTEAAGIYDETQWGPWGSGSSDSEPLPGDYGNAGYGEGHISYPEPPPLHVDPDANPNYNPWSYDPDVVNEPLLIDPNDDSMLLPSGKYIRVKNTTVQIARPFTPLANDDGHTAGYFFRCCLVGWTRATRIVSTSVSGTGGVYTNVESFKPDSLKTFKRRVQPGYNRLPMYHPDMDSSMDKYPGPDGYIGPLTGPWDAYAGLLQQTWAGGNLYYSQGADPGINPYTVRWVQHFGGYEQNDPTEIVIGSVLDKRVDYRQWECRIWVRAVYVRRELDGTEHEYMSKVAKTAILKVRDGVRPAMHPNHRAGFDEIIYGPKPEPVPGPTKEYCKGTISLYIITRQEKRVVPPAEQTPGGNSLGEADFLTLTDPPLKDLAYAAYDYQDVYTAPGSTVPFPCPPGLRLVGYTIGDKFPIFAKGPVTAYLNSDSDFTNPNVRVPVITVPVNPDPGTKIGEFPDGFGHTVQVFDRPPEKAL